MILYVEASSYRRPRPSRREDLQDPGRGAGRDRGPGRGRGDDLPGPGQKDIQDAASD